MKKIWNWDKKQKRGLPGDWHLWVLAAIPIVLLLVKVCSGYVYGSHLDWLGQHSVFPDYFRKLFYETGNLFPQYAADLGGGQNIYNFAYYGLFNPLYLFSYALPFIPMSTYIQGISLLGQMASGILCYVWLRNGHFEDRESFFAACMLALAGPITYHSYTQLMFVNYMPFLLLALIGYDRYSRKNKYGLLTAAVLLTVLCSFYFAVGAMVVLFLYGVTDWKKEQASSLPVLIKSLWHRFYPALLGCMLSLFYLVPVYCAMKSGRSESQNLHLSGLLIPDITINKLVYETYGLGLTAFAVVILCTSLFYKRCREKYLAVTMLVILTVPLFDWLLNGGLYLRDKAIIPFLPVMCWLAAAFIQRWNKKAIPGWKVTCGFLTALALLLIAVHRKKAVKMEEYALYMDLVICAIVLLVSFYKYKYLKNLICYVTLAIMIFASLGQDFFVKDRLVSREFLDELENPEILQAASQVLHEDTFSYRTEVRGDYELNKENQNRIAFIGQNVTSCYSSISNKDYQKFREKVFQLSKPTRNKLMQDISNNPIFLRFMGVKYILGSNAPAGYQKVGQSGNIDIYENQAAAPLAYITDQTITKSQYMELSYPERQMALLESAVAGTKNGNADTDVSPIELKLAEVEGPDLNIQKTESGYEITAKKGSTLTVTLSKPALTDRYLFITFQMKNKHPSRDAQISIQGEKNKLSASSAPYYNDNEVFHYTSLLKAGEKEIPVEFGKGSYEIRDIQAWTGTENLENSGSLYQSEALLKKAGDGNRLEGSLSADTDGWLITSIPYDEHFQIILDGEEVKAENVNMGFVGIPVAKGVHQITMTYQAPGRTLGMAATGITIVILAADQIYRRKKRRNGH